MIEVAAVILENQQKKVLIGRRRAGGSCSGLWEFPGGKVEPGETLEQCAVRECREELGVTVRLRDIFDKAVHAYPDRTVALTFFRGEIAEGQPKTTVHHEICWADKKMLTGYEFCPADRDILKKLEQE